MTWTDEHSPSARRPPTWLLVLAVAVVAVTVAGSVFVATRSDSPAPSSATPSGQDGVRPTVDRTDATLGAVDAQQRALDEHDRSAFLRTWAADSRSQRAARQIYTNLSRLDAQIALRVAASHQPITEVGPGALWPVDVDAAWRLPQATGRAAASTLTYTFEPNGPSGAKVKAVSAADGALSPMWLNEALVVRRGPGWTVVAGSAGNAAMLARVLPGVLSGVRDVVSVPSTPLVVYAPRTFEAMQDVVGPSVGLERIAGVTASADASTGPRTPTIVVLNPDELDQLDRRGRAVILAHEATHAITGAGVVRMPLWLSEGFADYVAFQVADVSVYLGAGVALHDAHADGVPRSFPPQQAFDGASAHLELAYEQSWLAVRSIARHQGEPALLRLYRAVVSHPGQLLKAVRSELDVSLAELTRQWRADIRELIDA